MERRRRYRVRLTDDAPIEITLGVPGWPGVSATLRDASALGVGLEIPAELPLAIDTGGTVDLTVWLLQDHRAVDLGAEVVDQMRVNGVRHLGLRFADPSIAERELAHGVGTIFNRRVAPRVRVEPSVAVTMSPLGTGDDAPTRATARDLSETGVGLELPADRAAILSNHERFELSMALDDEPLRLRARLRHRSLRDGRAMCGLEFEPEEASDAGRLHERLRRYVGARA